ncbi:MAG: pectinesterase family protein [Eubacteriales bacterium]|nr:pectinesterase family protein [Eubacteriales bacterium]
MRKNKMLKAVTGMALASILVVGTIPAAMDGIIGKPVVAVAAPQEQEAAVNPLTTIWKTADIGAHTTTGSYSYDEAAKVITVNGAGSCFGKDTKADDLFYAYFNVKEKSKVTVTAKVNTDSSKTSGMIGVMAKNDLEADSIAAAAYVDYGKGNIRLGRHGGAVNIASVADVEAFYVRLEVSEDAVYYTFAKDAEFTDIIKARSGMELAGLNATTVGFFATEGLTATFSDVNIVNEYSTDDGTVKKQVFDSNMGEIMPTASSSADYSGVYDPTFSFASTVDGNEIRMVSTRGGSPKAEIRSDKSANYWLFPALEGNYKVSADVTINSINSGTDKQGVAAGQFNASAGEKMQMDIVQANKNQVTQHNFTTSSNTVNGGDPKSAAGSVTAGNTYTLSYEKTDKGSIMITKSAAGEVLADNTAAPFDLTQAAASLQNGTKVSYGLAVAGADVTVANLTLVNSDGVVIYDMNDYYIAVGIAPKIVNAAALVADDRESINLTWDVSEEGSGNIKYSVYSSKNGGEYVKAGDSKVNSFSYAAMDSDGVYSFKIVPYGGETAGTPVETAGVNYQTPLAQAELSVTGTSGRIDVSWTAVEGAASYDLYKALGSDGKAEVVATTKETSYTDSAVTAEEPYYYYVVAKSDNNTSNPSETMQVLASDGHTGEYVYEKEATKITVIDKTNDTVFDDKASITMQADEAGTAKMLVNGKEVSSKAVTKDKAFTFIIELAKGRNDVELLFTDADKNTTRKVFNFVSNPKIDIVVDAAFTGEDGAEMAGYPTYKTVEAAVNSVAADNAEAKVIFIKNGEYNERVTVEAPMVSILGEDAENTHIFFSAAVADGTADSMWNRNAMYVDSTADGFTAENLTVENSYNYTNGSDQQADALCIVADKTACVNIRLIGYQDTLLTDSRVKDSTGNYEVTRQYFEKCYITGNVDFIYGAGTSVFEDCDIVARYTSYKPDGCFTAGRTYAATKYGFVFDNCRFLAEDGIADGAYRMARPWGADASATFINCYLTSAIQATGYGDMSGNSYKNARFAEYGSYGPGYMLNNDRPLLTSAQAKMSEAEAVMGDYDYAGVVSGLYKAAEVTAPEQPADSEQPKVEAETPATDVATGDSSAALLYALFALMAVLAIAGIIYEDKKRRA